VKAVLGGLPAGRYRISQDTPTQSQQDGQHNFSNGAHMDVGAFVDAYIDDFQ